MKRSNTTVTSPYYPPRAGWRSHLPQPAPRWRRRFRLLHARFPTPTKLLQDVLCVLVPGCAFHLAGWRKLGWGIFAGYVAAVLIFLAGLGYPVANWAFMVMLSVHTASVSQRMQPWLAERGLGTQMGVGMVLFLAVSLLIYVPARGWFQQHIAIPLPTSRGVMVLKSQVPPASIRRGDWLGYRILGSYQNGVAIQDGYGFGPVLALPGDRIEFQETACQVNGKRLPRLAHMPRSGDLVLPPNRWLVWPEVGVRMHGVGEDVAAQGMMKMAVVGQEQFVGRPFKRWFFRKQISP